MVPQTSLISETQSLMPTTGSQTRYSMVLIDDCPDVRSILKLSAMSMNVYLKTYKSLEDMYTIGRLKSFDAAIIDYNLGNWCGLEIAQYIDIFFPDLPVIVISADNLRKNSRWPSSIQAVINKNIGPSAIIRQTVRILDRLTAYKTLQNCPYQRAFE